MGLRKLPFLIGFLSLAGLAFGLGYIAYPLVHVQSGTALVAGHEAVSVSEPEADMTLFWEVWHLLDRDFLGRKPDTTARRYGAVKGLTQAFNDPYTFFVEPQPRTLEQDNLRGSFGGIGANILRDEEGFALSPLPDLPAARAGIQEGDRLLSVDGVAVGAEMSEDDVVALVRGPVDSEVVLVVRHMAGVEETVRITRTVIETPSIEYRLLDDQPESVDVGYIKHALFTERSPQEMEQALQALTAAGAARFVLDLRGNPGGILDSAIKIADLWLDSGLILIEERADGTRQEVQSEPGGSGVGYPLVVIIDGASASASEIVAGALQDNDRSRLVGEKSFGKGSVQLIHALSDESSLHVTTAEWLTPHGRQISGQGLTPDLVIEPGSDPLPVALDALADAEVTGAVATD